MARFRLLPVLIVVLLAFMTPASTIAAGTPDATPAATCAFEPISLDLLREMRDEIAENPPVTATPPVVGVSSDRTHLLDFPPPPGDPIDDATVGSIRTFLGLYADCLGIGELASVYGAWTEDLIRRSLGSDPAYADALSRVMEMESDPPVFAYPGISLLLLRAWRIETGHVVAVMQIVGIEQYWTMLLLPVGDSWRIDDIWSADPRMIGDNLSGPLYATPIAGE